MSQTTEEGSAASPIQNEVAGAGDPDELKGRLIEALREIYDPEIPVNIYELGLIYDIKIEPEGKVRVEMTLTSPHCPVAESMPGQVEAALREVGGVTDAAVNLVWEPTWNQSMMTEAARLELGFM